MHMDAVPGWHGGTASLSRRQTIVDPNSVPGSGNLGFLQADVHVTTLLYQINQQVIPNWFGIAVADGIVDFTKPNLFFHPTPGQDGYDDNYYFSKTGPPSGQQWFHLFYYMELLGYEVDAETLNVAARIQAVASPDSVVVPELTHRLAGAAFDYEELGLHELKGIRDAARLWRVVGESTTRGRFDRRVVGGLTPLVGRAEEIVLLRRRWDRAKEGDGQLVLLSAPAGFGKSRLTQAFREDLDDPSVICLQYFGSPFHVNSAFYPFIRQLEWVAGIVRTDTGPQKLDKLEAILEGSTEGKAEAAALLADLLSIP